MMDFWKSVSGMIELELSSGSIADALSAMNRHNIAVYCVRSETELSARMVVTQKDYQKLCALTEKRGDRVRLLRRRGIYWPLRNLLSRPVLLWGLVFLLASVMYMPTRVLFVQVEGNTKIPAGKILSAAEECGIRFGASRREVRSEKVKNALLSLVPELQWAGVNTTGCVAIISVREGAESSAQQKIPQVSAMIACRDGIIERCTATSGNLLVSPGQAVKEGQQLISGYTDCGFVIQATHAEGEVFAKTSRNLEVIMPSKYLHKDQKVKEMKKYSLVIGKKRINLCNSSRIWDATYDRMYKEYAVTLPGGFRLPVVLCVEQYILRHVSEQVLQQTDAARELSAFASSYLRQQMVAGKVLQKAQTMRYEAGVFGLDGNYTCSEMIGRVRMEKIGEENG